MLKRIITDPAFIFLLLINAYCIWYYQAHPNEFNSLVFLYWGQSVLIGLFNFVDMLTVKNVIPGSIKLNEKPVTDTAERKGCSAFFFLVHYGFFHFVYGIFILIYTKLDINFKFVWIGLAAFSLNLIIQFIQHKQLQQTTAANLSTMFFLPYLRIIPMHLMIILPAFFHVQASILFLLLKTAADIIMYLITSPLHKVGVVDRIIISHKIT